MSLLSMFDKPSELARLIDECTSEMQLNTDWALNMQICDYVNRGGTAAAKPHRPDGTGGVGGGDSTLAALKRTSSSKGTAGAGDALSQAQVTHADTPAARAAWWSSRYALDARLSEFLCASLRDSFFKGCPAVSASFCSTTFSPHSAPVLVLGEEMAWVPWEAALNSTTAGGLGGGAHCCIGGRIPSDTHAALGVLAMRVAQGASSGGGGGSGGGGALPSPTPLSPKQSLWRSFECSGLSLLSPSPTTPPPTKGVMSYVVNPAGDLFSTADTLRPVLAALACPPGPLTHIGPPLPATAAVLSALSPHATQSPGTYLYAGHGAGEVFLPRDAVAKHCNGVAPTALLMGCSSACLRRPVVRHLGLQEGQGAGGGLQSPPLPMPVPVPVHAHPCTPLEGAALAYLWQGAPRLAGFLWDVTDKDCDRLTVALLKGAFGEGGGSQQQHQHPPLHAVLPAARAACKLPCLVGAAGVLYGLPPLNGGGQPGAAPQAPPKGRKK